MKKNIAVAVIILATFVANAQQAGGPPPNQGGSQIGKQR